MSDRAAASHSAPSGGSAPHYGYSLQQRRADAIQEQARKEEAKKRLFRPATEAARPLEPTADMVSIRLAEELNYIQRLIERLGEDLVSNPLIVHRHGQSLQSLDLMNQLLGHLAKVIGTDDREAAIDRIGMQELRARLKRRPIAAFASLAADEPAVAEIKRSA